MEQLPGNPMHTVLGTPLKGPWPQGAETLYVGMGCYWGAERIMWKLPGVVTTAVGFMGGDTTDPSYPQVCTGATGHAETVMVVYTPWQVTPERILKAFWENHDPTTPDRQGNDVGTQYRSFVAWTTPEQEAAARATHAAFDEVLRADGRGPVVTELWPAQQFWYAHEDHQQYLDKNPGGYCNHGPNGYTCPVGIANLPAQQDVDPA